MTLDVYLMAAYNRYVKNAYEHCIGIAAPCSEYLGIGDMLIIHNFSNIYTIGINETHTEIAPGCEAVVPQIVWEKVTDSCKRHCTITAKFCINRDEFTTIWRDFLLWF